MSKPVTVYIVLTEENYGGSDVRVFTSKIKADSYAEMVSRKFNVETIVKRTIISGSNPYKD